MAQISWQHQKIIWVYGPQSGLTLLFGKWRFWWFRLRHPLGLCHGVPHCRTSTMTYSRTLFLLIVENKSGLKLSVHTITPQNDIGEWFTAFRLHSITHLFQKTHVILLWSEFSVTTTTLLFLISLVTPLKEQHDVKSEKLWFLIHSADYFYSSQRNRHELGNHHRIIQLYVYYKRQFEPV